MTRNYCRVCKYKQLNSDLDSHCYMFKEAPAELTCGQYTIADNACPTCHSIGFDKVTDTTCDFCEGKI